MNQLLRRVVQITIKALKTKKAVCVAGIVTEMLTLSGEIRLESVTPNSYKEMSNLNIGAAREKRALAQLIRERIHLDKIQFGYVYG